MNAAISALACDIGAGSGRIIECSYDGENIDLKQISRFTNGPIKVGDSLFWDILGLFRDIKHGLVKASNLGIEAVSFGMDTWGNDFSFIDKKGILMENPHSYRDSRTIDIIPYVRKFIPDKALYSRNGIQQVRMNTFYQLVSIARDREYILNNAQNFLFIPDLLNYFLTGEVHSEYTLSTISQLYSYNNGNWDSELLKLFNIPENLFPDIIKPGESCGSILPSICNDIHINSIPIIAVGAHDTASAVVAVAEPEKQAIFISSGTWSIIGTETNEPIINDCAFRYNFSNEGAVGDKIRFLKNVMGLWILQEIQRRFSIEGRNYSFADLCKLAENEQSFVSFIDPDDECFYEPANMPKVIQNYCERTGQKVPQSDGQIVRCAIESLAFKYRYVVEQLQELIGKSPDSIHIIGGGSQNELLCQMTASCCNKRVFAGPVEATALGNAVTQFISLGELSDIKEARTIIRKSFPPKEFEPTDTELWSEQYRRYLSITKILH